MISKELIIIGGGPAGLKAGEEALKRGIDYIILEQGTVGYEWRKIRPDMPMLSPSHPQRDWTSLSSDFPIWKLDVERPYCSAQEFVNYLEHFTEHFNLNIKLNTAVQSVKKRNGFFEVKTKSENFVAPIVIIATGFFNNPYIPDIPGVADNKAVTHTHYYQSRDDFKFQRVIIVGAGNSAVEIAINLSGFSQVYLISRSKMKFFSKSRNLCNIRGAYESYLKELIQMGLIRHYPSTQVKEVNGNMVSLDSGQTIETNYLMFATGYRPVIKNFTVEGLDYKAGKGSRMFSPCGEFREMDNLYFAGPMFIKSTINNFIHGFIKMIPATITEIESRLKKT